jgi:hypothetical protein
MVEPKFSFKESTALKKRLHTETTSKDADPTPLKKAKVDQVENPVEEIIETNV